VDQLHVVSSLWIISTVLQTGDLLQTIVAQMKRIGCEKNPVVVQVLKHSGLLGFTLVKVVLSGFLLVLSVFPMSGTSLVAASMVLAVSAGVFCFNLRTLCSSSSREDYYS
jgi:hypothetical protein